MGRCRVCSRSSLAPLVGLLGLLGMACQGPEITYGEPSVALRAPRPPRPAVEDAAVMEPVDSVTRAAGAAGDVALQPSAGTSGGPAAPRDAGTSAPDDAAVESTPLSFCPPPAQELFDPGLAGDGTFSGCPVKVCEGSTVLPSTDLSAYVPVDGVAAMAARYEGCTRVRGDVLLNFTPDTDLEKLRCLERVDGSLVILNTSSLEDLTGLGSLQHVGGDLRIARLDDVFADASSLESLSALANLRAVGGSLVLRTPFVMSLDGLQSLRAVGGSFVLDVPVELANLAGARNLQAIGGDLRIAGTYRFTSIYGLQKLETIGGSFELTGDAGIPVFHEALPKVTCIGGDITIEEPNPFHEELDLLPVLERVGGGVTIKGHPFMRSITMLKNVSFIGGSLQVQNNDSLEELDLGRLEAIEGVLRVTYNPLLEECPLIELADAIGVGALSEIHDNSRSFGSFCRTAF